MNNAFQGKRIRQNETKLAQMKKREKRLRKIGLSILSFQDKTFPWLAYFKQRNEQRATKKAEAAKNETPK